MIEYVYVREALVYSGLAFLMLNTALYAKLPGKFRIQFFRNSTPDIVRVCGARAEVKGYIDVPL